MRIRFALIALGLTSAAATAGDKDHFAKMFGSRCATCHTVPDPQVRSDLAWLDQVNRTS